MVGRLHNENGLPLTEGAYTSRALIANAQRCVNLYPEKNPADSEAPVTHNVTPGLTVLSTAPVLTEGRCLYRASNNVIYAVVGSGVYMISASWVFTLLGTIGTTNGICSMVDDDTQILLVDGSPTGYKIILSTNVFSKVTDVNFFGADKVGFLDTLLVSNVAATQQFQSTKPNVFVWDPLYFASKTGYNDRLVTLAVCHREIWLLGSQTSEVWYNAGNAGFPFALFPGTFIQHGCAAKYSVAKHDLNVFWLSQDDDGQGIVVMGSYYKAERISTYAIENAIAGYSRIDDAIGFTYQQGGHIFYVLTFPTADRTWVYDKQTDLWHERNSIDANGVEHRWRPNCAVNAYGTVVALDYQNGKLYKLDLNSFNEDGLPIVRRRGFPHLVSNGNRVSYACFRADIQCGEIANYSQTSPAPMIFLRWSDDRGRSWRNPVGQSLGATGEFILQPQWRRLGMARDRVFELFWSIDAFTALNGAWVDPLPMGS